MLEARVTERYKKRDLCLMKNFFETLRFFKIVEQKNGDCPQLLQYVCNLLLFHTIISPHTAHLSLSSLTQTIVLKLLFGNRLRHLYIYILKLENSKRFTQMPACTLPEIITFFLEKPNDFFPIELYVTVFSNTETRKFEKVHTNASLHITRK